MLESIGEIIDRKDEAMQHVSAQTKSRLEKFYIFLKHKLQPFNEAILSDGRFEVVEFDNKDRLTIKYNVTINLGQGKKEKQTVMTLMLREQDSIGMLVFPQSQFTETMQIKELIEEILPKPEVSIYYAKNIKQSIYYLFDNKHHYTLISEIIDEYINSYH